MGAISNEAFLAQKITGFSDFLELCLSKRLDHEISRHTEAKQKIAELRSIKIEHFVLWCTTELCPYKSHVKKYI